MPASTYNCTTNPNPPNNGLCYAVVQWTCCGQFFGVATSPYVKWVGCNPKYCTTGNDWHTNCTEWLAEVDDWSYANCPLHQCWIEAGWVEGCSSWDFNFWCALDTTRYYWAEMKPCGGYDAHIGDPISPDYNTLDTISIQTTGSGGNHDPDCATNNQWSITILSGGSGNGLNATSTYMPIQPNYWTIGLEVAGKQGNAASAGNFIYNEVWPQGGLWTWTTSSGNNIYSVSPASGGWATAPAPGNYGGNWYNTCSCNYNG